MIKRKYQEINDMFLLLGPVDRETFLRVLNLKSLLFGPILTLVGLTGCLIRNILGWILTAQWVYNLLAYVIVFDLIIDSKPLKSIVVVLAFFSGILYLLNHEKAMTYFQIEADKRLRLNLNLIGVIIGMVYSIIRGYSILQEYSL